MKHCIRILALVTLLCTAWGCGNRLWQDTKDTTGDTVNYVFDTAPTARSYHDQEAIPLIEINHLAADELYDNIGITELGSDTPIYVTNFVNGSNPTDPAIFGQVTTQQVVDRLVQHGVHVSTGSPGTVYTTPAETDGDNPAPQTEAGQLVGTYVVGDNFIYMSAKIIRLHDTTIVSAHDWTIPISDNVRELLPQLQTNDGMTPSVKTKFD